MHPRDPYHRIDVVGTDRHIRISLDGELLAETDRAVALFESNLPPRWYIPREDVVAALEPSDTVTRCPYKGTASYYSVNGAKDLVWYYDEPLRRGGADRRAAVLLQREGRHRARRRAGGAAGVALEPAGQVGRLSILRRRAASASARSCRPLPGDAQGAIAGGQRVGVAVAVGLERFAVGVELPTVELDDQPLGSEQRVDLVAGHRDVDQGAREPVALAEGGRSSSNGERVGLRPSRNGSSSLAPRWLSAAPGPQASTAAEARSRGVAAAGRRHRRRDGRGTAVPAHPPGDPAPPASQLRMRQLPCCRRPCHAASAWGMPYELAPNPRLPLPICWSSPVTYPAGDRPRSVEPHGHHQPPRTSPTSRRRSARWSASSPTSRSSPTPSTTTTRTASRSRSWSR